MPSLPRLALALAASLALAQAEHLRVVWSSGFYGAIGPPGGEATNDHSEGFAILRDDGEAVYADDTPYGYSPCRNVGDGRTFEICGDCWDSCFRFKCIADFGGNPETCEVQDASGKAIGGGTGTKYTDFIGIVIGFDTTCVVEFESDGGGCPVDEGNSPLHATGESV
jgi:hypothetical protein